MSIDRRQLLGNDAAHCGQAEQEIAQWIARNEPVRCFFPTAKELEQLPLRKKPDPHEALRIVCIGSSGHLLRHARRHHRAGAGGAHPLLAAEPGNLRIFFVAGLRALNYARVRIEQGGCGGQASFPAT